ncbi:MAG: hypothetical protein AAGJ84_10715 [Pseudomonadota bacterium]
MLFASSAVLIAACASSAPPPVVDPAILAAQAEAEQSKALMAYVSDVALRTAVLDEAGDPVGPAAYDEPSDAVRAGDMAAFVTMIRARTLEDGDVSPFAAMVLSIDEAAAGEFETALETLKPALEDPDAPPMPAFLEAWILALKGDSNQAIRAHREMSRRLPGLTGDLSLATMLEGFERIDEALAVYSAMTPQEIVAPEHDFDPQGLVFSHVRLVIARHALLLRRQGRIAEAQDLYRKLANAEPEQAVGYADAIASLESGRGLDDESVSLNFGFARALGDYSLSLAYQRILTTAMMGGRIRGYDETKGAFDQLALLIDPDNEDLRLTVYDDLFEQAMFDAAYHVLSTAPDPSSALKVAEAATLLRLDRRDDAYAASKTALDLAAADEKLSVTSAAMGLYSLMEKRQDALQLASVLPSLAESDAEKATAHGMSAAVYGQFAKFDLALNNAREARRLDDTHARRMALADALADAGEIEEGLEILRTEALSRPNDPYMLNTLGYFLVLHTDRLEEAFKVLARAVALAPNDSYIADSFGWVRYKMGDLEGALRYIELSRRELAPNRNWEIEDHIGDVYWHLDRKEDARDAWANALEEFPPDEERARIIEKLEQGLQGPPPEKRPLPDVSLEDDGEVDRQDI